MNDSAPSEDNFHQARLGGLHWPVASVRHYLLALILAVFLPMLVFAGAIAVKYAAAQRHVIEARRLDVTNNLNDLLERDIAGIAGVLRGLASVIYPSGSLTELRANFAQRTSAVMRQEHLAGFVLTDQTGKLLASNPPEMSTTVLETPFLATVLAGGVDVSDLRVDPSSGAKWFVVSLPVLSGGELTHVLRAVVDVTMLQGLFREARLQPDWVSAVVDGNGIFLARSRGGDGYIGTPAQPALFAAARQSAAEGQFANVTLDGTPVENSYRRAPSGWTAVVGVPVRNLDAPRNRALAMLGAAGLVLASFAISVAYLLGKRIAYAVGNLQRAALDVVDGRAPAEMHSPFTELRDVTVALNYAAAQTQDRMTVVQQLSESEERQRLALEAGAFGSWDMNLLTGASVWSAKLFSLYGHEVRQPGPVEREIWHDRVHPDDRGTVLENFVKARDKRELYISEHRIVLAQTGKVRWLRATGKIHYDHTGLPTRFIGVARDITTRKTLEVELASSQARYRLALALGRIGSWETHYDTGRRLWTAEAQALFGLNLADGAGHVGGEGDEFRAAFHPDDRHLLDQYRRLAQTQDTIPAEYRVVHPDGTVLWLAGSGHVIARDGAGNPLRQLSVVADITERKVAEQHSVLLMREIAHRSKNLLAVIQAIANQTLRSANSLKDYHERFLKRLQGLAASNDVVVAQGWRGAPLDDLVHEHLAPFIDFDGGRVRVGGPHAVVDANAGQAIGLALHELATNAVKYGALSTPLGTITVTWALHETDNAEFVLQWIESGGPPVKAPDKAGFGNIVIERMVAQAVRGKVSLDFAPTGLRWTLRMPARNVVMDLADRVVRGPPPLQLIS